jgi:hypothetical protein
MGPPSDWETAPYSRPSLGLRRRISWVRELPKGWDFREKNDTETVITGN